jgi:crotonobetainyl-CoA:carnitine CoA-transferase CaiB-like acyl-CoA transferase
MWPVAAESPLAGIVVVSMEQAISAPFASRQLADLGATVIKVERSDGDLARHYDSVVSGISAFFFWANRGKQSLALDLDDPGADRLLEELIAGADVFLHNLSPEAAARRHLDATSLHARFPHLIACEISGYGVGGPRSADKAYDLAIQAEAGVFSITGDEEMSKVGFSAADISAGMYALSSILAALVKRERTGQGSAISISMLDCLAEWVSAPMYAAVYGGGQAPRTGRRHHAIAPYGTFALSDGSTILVAVQSDREWRDMAAHLLEQPDLGTDARFASNADRIRNVEELEELIRAVLQSLTSEQARARLRAGRTAVAQVNDLRGVWEHPQLRARDHFHAVRTEHGDVEMIDAPFGFVDGAPGPGWIPALNEHDPAVIARVRERGARALSDQ